MMLVLSRVRSMFSCYFEELVVEPQLDEAFSAAAGRDGETDSPELPTAVSQGPVVQQVKAPTVDS